MPIVDYGSDIYGIDLFEEGRPFRSNAYVIKDRQIAVIDTGSSNSHDVLVEGLAQLGLGASDIDHLIITHVHLDHAGGAGQMMQKSVKALLHAHPTGARHLIDPSRLVKGARQVYGEEMNTLFGPLIPVNENRVIAQQDGGRLRLGRHTLTFYHTPGHAKHHMCIADDISQGIFSGDMVGIRYQPGYTGWDFPYGFPTTSPGDFDPDVMVASLNRLQMTLHPRRIFHTHFGMSEPADEAFDFSRTGVHYINELIKELPEPVTYQLIYQALSQIIGQDLRRLGHKVDTTDPLGVDLMLNSQGILVYIQKKAAGKL